VRDVRASYPELQPADERASLEQRLEHVRVEVLARIEDLTDAQASARVLPATDLTVGGVVKHLARVEDRWFRCKLLGEPLPEPWASSPGNDDPSWAFTSSVGEPVASLVALYEAACERSRAAAARFDSLDAVAAEVSFDKVPVNLRWLLVHMVEETAWHLGHLDLLRDALLAEG
jgi:uncharacterized damage-inducible protein DinB